MNPIWNEKIEIPNISASNPIRVVCFDEDLIMDECVGEAEFKAAKLFNINEYIGLYH